MAYDHKDIALKMVDKFIEGKTEYSFDDLRKLLGKRDMPDTNVGYHARKIRPFLKEKSFMLKAGADAYTLSVIEEKVEPCMPSDQVKPEPAETKPVEESCECSNCNCEEPEDIDDFGLHSSTLCAPPMTDILGFGAYLEFIAEMKDPLKVIAFNKFLEAEGINMECRIKDLELVYKNKE